MEAFDVFGGQGREKSNAVGYCGIGTDERSAIRNAFGKTLRKRRVRVFERTVSQAGEVSPPVSGAVVFAALWVVPLDAEPEAVCSVDWADIADGANIA